MAEFKKRGLFVFFVSIALFFVLISFPKFTHGFRLNKLVKDTSSENVSDSLSNEIRQLLNQPFRFLGHGKQVYVFESKDGTYVLKVLRKTLKPHPMRIWFRKKLFYKKSHAPTQDKNLRLFTSAHLARSLLSDLTGVFFIHLSTTDENFPKTCLVDSIGRKYTVNLNKYRFVLQKKGISLQDALLSGVDCEKYLDQFIYVVEERVSRKLSNVDVKVATNFGVVDGKVVEWDIGNFVYSESLIDPLAAQKEKGLFFEKMRQHLYAETPHLLNYFQKKSD